MRTENSNDGAFNVMKVPGLLLGTDTTISLDKFVFLEPNAILLQCQDYRLFDDIFNEDSLDGSLRFSAYATHYSSIRDAFDFSPLSWHTLLGFESSPKSTTERVGKIRAIAGVKKRLLDFQAPSNLSQYIF
ncbi:uncharacterized protein FOMMEDRAFT_165011 [Fomitiporia mediterranea MF3/22]|uniref:uncharacterized protein n=1 Tax=Fomitiporia mediterranea (strain MF3/22) TaxID=694068 RepID=UPI0004407B4D|nr:uncharacterized protein FOMMEDRAFT_165011 [Fomitiporia mediterranea MF3/22]EJD08417.1 hypothetical protein FOMMEDRAFT_165011 [Fomitiporia mediterranea MF3/22]